MRAAALRRIAWGLCIVCVLAAILATPTVLARREVGPVAILWGPLVVAGLIAFEIRRKRGDPALSDIELREVYLLGLVLLFGGVFYLGFVAVALGYSDELSRAWIVALCAIFFIIGFFLRAPKDATPPKERIFAFAMRHWRWGYFGLTGVAIGVAFFAKDPSNVIVLWGLLPFFTPGALSTPGAKEPE